MTTSDLCAIASLLVATLTYFQQARANRRRARRCLRVVAGGRSLTPGRYRQIGQVMRATVNRRAA